MRTRSRLALLALALSACGSDPRDFGLAGGDVGLEDAAAEPTLRGARFCEITGATLDGQRGFVALEAWSTHDLNDCPADVWDRMTPALASTALRSTFATLDGPRYWTVDEATDIAPADAVVRDVGGLEMQRIAAVQLTAGTPETTPYAAQFLQRTGRYRFDARSPLYVLLDGDGTAWVMLSFTTAASPILSLESLADAGGLLDLPEGWRYEVRSPDEPLELEAVGRDSTIEDSLGSVYLRAIALDEP